MATGLSQDVFRLACVGRVGELFDEDAKKGQADLTIFDLKVGLAEFEEGGVEDFGLLEIATDGVVLDAGFDKILELEVAVP